MKFCMTVAALGILLLLCGCPPKTGGNGQQGNGGNQNGNKQPGGTVRLPLEIAADDPVFLAIDFTDQRMWALARAIGAPLMLADSTSEAAVPGLARQAEMNADGQSWKFTLPTVPGHEEDPQFLGKLLRSKFIAQVNGARTPLRAEILDLVSGARNVSSGALDISGISLDDNSISFALTRPYSGFDLWLSQPGLGLVDTTVVTDLDGALEIVSSEGFGAWRVDRFETEDGITELILEPNPASLMGQPAANELRFVLEPDRSRQVDLYRLGRLDAASVPASMANVLANDTALADSLQQHDTAASLLVLFDHGQDPWGDQMMQDKVGLRQSLGLSIDRESLEEENNGVIHGWGHFLPQHFRDGIPMELLNKPTYPRTAMLEEARAKQKESDHEQGSHLPLNMDVAFLAHDNLEALDRDLLQFWSDISIRLQPFPLSNSDLLRRIDLNSHEVIVFWNYPAWPSMDACIYPQLHSSLTGEGANFSRISIPEINKAIEDAQREPDSALSRLYYQQVSRIIEERGLFVPAAYSTPLLLIRPGLSVTPGAYDFNASLQGQDFRRIGLAK